MFCNFFILFVYIMIICQTQSKNLYCKIQITVNRNFNLRCVMNLWQLQRNLSPHQPHCQTFFSNNLGLNFEFEFCKNIEDKFNGGMPCITYYVALHVYIRRSQILLTFNRVQMMYSLFLLYLKQKLHIKGSFSYKNAGTRLSTSF